MTTQIDRIYFMGTCLADVYFPKAGLSAMQLLQREGLKVIYPQNQTCCAQPAFNAGYRQEALSVARSLMACFPKDLPIVIPSASCTDMIRHHWSELFAGQSDAPQARAIAGRVYELTEFLSQVLKVKLSDYGQPTQVAIHSSCSCRNGLKGAKHIENLVGQLTQVEVLEQARKKECCGFGGTFALKQADISGAMVADKTQALKDSGAVLTISQDLGCLMNIGGALTKQKSKLKTQHVAEFLWERTNRE